MYCPVCKQVQISYVIGSHIDQNTQDSRTTARVTKENGLSHQEKGPFLYRKKATIGQKNGMAHRKRAWRSKKRVWRSAMLKGPRGNTKERINEVYFYSIFPRT